MRTQYREWLFSLLAGALAAFISAGVAFFLVEPDSKEISRSFYSQFEKAAIEHLKISDAVDIESLSLLYEGVTNFPKDALEFRSGFREALLKIYLKIVSGELGKAESKSRTKWAASFKETIFKYDERSPYQGLHPVEGGLFRDLSSINNDPKVEDKLKQLANVVKARFEELERAKQEARWSLIFGIAGVVGAVISILMSLLQAAKRANN